MTLRRLTLILLSLYTLLTAVTILIVAFGGTPLMILTPLTTLAGFSFVILHAARRQGWNSALRLLGLVFGVSLLFESVGVATGIVYGPYHYTDKLGPLFLDLVPYLIPVAWFMMSYPSFVIAERLVPGAWKPWQRLLAVAAVGGMVMTAWDLVMDPVMVFTGHWVWEVEGLYQGIPIHNFIGWWVTVFTTYALFLLMEMKNPPPLRRDADGLAVLAYLVTALGVILPCIFRGAGELALIGTFAMLPWVIAGWLKLKTTA